MLANCRNDVLLFIRQNLTVSLDYLIMIDMDIRGWDLNGIVSTFTVPNSKKWDVMCARGIALHGLYRGLEMLMALLLCEMMACV